MKRDRDFKIDDGKWFPTMNELSEKLMQTNLNSSEWRLVEMFRRYCHGYNKASCEIRFSEMASFTGLPKATVARSLKRLAKRNIIQKGLISETKPIITYKLNSKISTWQPLKAAKKAVSFATKNGLISDNVPYKNNIKTITARARVYKKSHFRDLSWLDETLWDEYVEQRYAQKKPIKTFIGLSRLLKFLFDRKSDHRAILNQSIEREWVGLFELNNQAIAAKIKDQEADKAKRNHEAETKKTQERLKEYERLAKLKGIAI